MVRSVRSGNKTSYVSLYKILVCFVMINKRVIIVIRGIQRIRVAWKSVLRYFPLASGYAGSKISSPSI